MPFSPEFFELLQDSAELSSPEVTNSEIVHKDTLHDSTGEILPEADTVAGIIVNSDSVPNTPEVVRKSTARSTVVVKAEPKDITVIDTISSSEAKNIEHYKRYHLYEKEDSSFSYQPFNVYSTQHNSLKSRNSTIHFEHREFQQSRYSWALIVGFFSIFLLIILRTYYQKSMDQVLNTLVNFQLSEKMLREKNVIIRRAFYFLNLNYILVFSLFVLLLLNLYDFEVHDSYLVSYLLITAGIILILLVRLILLYLTGIIFNSLSIFTEYIHNIYLINKNLGIVLLPFVFASLYTSSKISEIILITGLVTVCIATLYKYFRGVQIIIKNDILKFYSFLYLCTLELLPLVVSFKIIITLR